MKNSEGVTLILREFLLNLTAGRAFRFFLVCFLLGVGSIWADLWLPWVPCLVVLAYGLALLYSAVALQVPHSEATNNSPYFLGFVFFLASLLRAFYSASFERDGQLDVVIHQLGVALLTTIIALPLRQALFAFSPSQSDEDLFYRNLEEELRRSASEFRRAQVEMVQIIQEMVEVRRSFFTEERQAVKRYVESLSKATSILDGSINSYPNAISATLKTCTQNFGELEERIRSLAAAAATVDGPGLKSSLASFAVVGTAAKELEASIAALQGALFAARQAADLIPENFGRLAGAAGRDLEASVAALQASMSGARRAAELVPENLTAQISNLGDRLNGIPVAAHEQIKILKEDISNLDHILDTFIVLLHSKVEAIR
ncbi:MAG TPA: hypothetical protein VG225_05160 [Terracidiphilus sp.]|jgi:exonuclease VII small subunit|nr:hypothetical protein [Terracidiphilus sp.]